MKNIFNKTDAPYLVAGTLAALASLVPAASLMAPLFFFSNSSFIGCPALSTIIITALLCAVVIKNNTISEKDAVVQAQKQENSELKAQLTKKEAEVQTQEQKIAKKDNKISSLEKQLDDETFHDALDEIPSSFSVTSPPSYL